MEHQATYSPEDNKLRIYPAYRLDKAEYYQLKEAGFKWAAKQELFVAPMWTPDREDIALEFCGEIEDEDTSLVERAEFRADRFQGYSENRLKDAESAKKVVDSIASNIPLGQPILVGHHSEKRARRDAKKIENGMRKAVKMWETSGYWKARAKGAIRHAKYKERPDVRARRIKKIEAQKRKCKKQIKESRQWLNVWLTPTILTKQRAMFVANYCYVSGMWSDLDQGKITAREARNKHVPMLERSIAYNERWIEHCKNRLIYEKAMLEEQGASDLLKPKPKPKQFPLCNYRAPEGIDIENKYHKGEMIHYPQVEMSKAEYAKIHNDYKGTRPVENSHRVRICYIKMKNYCVFLTDSKAHKKPEPIEVKPKIRPDSLRTVKYQAPKQTEFDDMKNALKNGIKVEVVNQLFETPWNIAKNMIEYADIQEGERILEPSAGKGAIAALIREVIAHYSAKYNVGPTLKCVELNQNLSRCLERFGYDVLQGDFLSMKGELGNFNKIIMNPPFKNGEDIKHIKHAVKFLRQGGRLVALCANGPRQQKQLKPLASYWEDLPQGTFKESETMVNVALLTIDR